MKWLELCKLRPSFFAALSSAACYILASSAVTLECVMISAGVFLLASGAGAFNHYQESETDGLMPSATTRRPKVETPRVTASATIPPAMSHSLRPSTTPKIGRGAPAIR